MKTNMLLKSGIGLLVLAGVGIANVAAGQGEGDLYDNLRISHETQSSMMPRGAAGPIRESMDVQPAAEDIYQSLMKFHEAQKSGFHSSDRGAQGPIRSENDMAMERNEKEWRQMVGIFYGSD